tara:strand:+ start:231 stop:599 length:369 start_codon:yes stop_codon:yes gene_type:complete
MINELLRLANHLDNKGLQKEADYLDFVIKKMAQESEAAEPCEPYNVDTGEGKACQIVNYQVRKGDSWWSITNAHSPGRTMDENAALNNMTTDDVIHPCQDLKLWSIPAYEGGANNPACIGEE